MRPVHAQSPEQALVALRAGLEGISTVEAWRRRRRHGTNELRRQPRRSLLRIVVNQFTNIIVVLLGVAALLALAFGHVIESAAVLAVIFLNAAIGFVTELRAIRSLESLQAFNVARVKVRRKGRLVSIPARGLVPGDIVVLEAGDVVAADLRLLEASRVLCNESVLTGESMPVAKQTAAVDASTPVPDRDNMLYHGTSITRGSATAVVAATGDGTELGRIAHLASEAEIVETPLERRIDQLGRQFMWIALLLAAAIGVTGIITGRDIYIMVESAIALAVATVPEGLPMVATLALARGMWRMVRRHALIERLAAVETLGSTTLILTDKTGTLTENRMTVSALLAGTETEFASTEGEVHPDWRRAEREDADWQAAVDAMTVATLCTNAEQSGAGVVGEPMEVALLEAAQAFFAANGEPLPDLKEINEYAFDPAQKMMATVHELADGGCWYLVKGAPGPVIRASTAAAGHAGDLNEAQVQAWLDRSAVLGARGLRVLALAGKRAAAVDEPPYEGLTLFGLVGLHDPPRADVAAAIRACQQAGMKVVMATGDHAATAQSIAVATGLVSGADVSVVEGDELDQLGASEQFLDANVFARVTPEQKLRLIEAFQARGEVVAMLGDGVNDAPALRRANIGVAMGQRGSQVAREAADMVLLDDRFATIVEAVAQGRVIFSNIRKFVVYLMSCNLSELLVVGLAALSGAPLPLLPLHILYLNLVTDVFPAFALGVGEGESDVLERPPRPPDEPLLSRRQWYDIGVGAAIIAVATLAAFALALLVLGLDAERAVTVSFLTLAFSQVWHVFNMRDRGSRMLSNEVTRNRFVWGAVSLCAVLVLIPVYFSPLSSILSLVPATVEELALVAGCSVVPLVVGQARRSFGGSGGSGGRG